MIWAVTPRGYKKSGIGREKGFVALRNYTQIKNIAIKFGI